MNLARRHTAPVIVRAIRPKDHTHEFENGEWFCIHSCLVIIMIITTLPLPILLLLLLLLIYWYPHKIASLFFFFFLYMILLSTFFKFFFFLLVFIIFVLFLQSLSFVLQFIFIFYFGYQLPHNFNHVLWLQSLCIWRFGRRFWLYNCPIYGVTPFYIYEMNWSIISRQSQNHSYIYPSYNTWLQKQINFNSPLFSMLCPVA